MLYTSVRKSPSEYVFALFADHFRRVNAGQSRIEAMAAALTAAIAKVEELTGNAGLEEPSLLNLVVADGNCAVVSRYISRDPEKANSLYVHTGRRYVCQDGVCRMVQPERETGAVIVASEPLSEDKGWTRVQPNNLVLVHSDLRLEMRSF